MRALRTRRAGRRSTAGWPQSTPQRQRRRGGQPARATARCAHMRRMSVGSLRRGSVAVGRNSVDHGSSWPCPPAASYSYLERERARADGVHMHMHWCIRRGSDPARRCRCAIGAAVASAEHEQQQFQLAFSCRDGDATFGRRPDRQSQGH